MGAQFRQELPRRFQLIVDLMQSVKGLLIQACSHPQGGGHVRLIFVPSRKRKQDEEHKKVDIHEVYSEIHPRFPGFFERVEVGIVVDQTQEYLDG